MLNLLKQLDEMRTLCWYFVVNGSNITVMLAILSAVLILFGLIYAIFFKRIYIQGIFYILVGLICFCGR